MSVKEAMGEHCEEEVGHEDAAVRELGSSASSIPS